MKFIPTRQLRSNPSELWKLLENEEIVITVNGKPKALMIKADEDFDKLIDLITQARAEMALEKIRLESITNETDKLSNEEIDKEIEKARKEY